MGLGVEPQSREVTKQGTGRGRNRGFAESGQPWGRPDRCSSLLVRQLGPNPWAGVNPGDGDWLVVEGLHVEISRDWLVVSTRCNGRLATIIPHPLQPASPKHRYTARATATVTSVRRSPAWRNAREIRAPSVCRPRLVPGRCQARPGHFKRRGLTRETEKLDGANMVLPCAVLVGSRWPMQPTPCGTRSG